SLQNVQAHNTIVWTLAVAPDGKTVATASADGTVKVWDAGTFKEKAVLRHPPHVRAVTFSPDGKTLASGALNGTVMLWDTASWQERATLQGHTDLVFSVRFS